MLQLLYELLMRLFHLLFPVGLVRRAEAPLGTSREEISELREQSEQMRAQISFLQTQLSKHVKTFRVAQYNILAGYLGNNREPWFLYGVDMPEERRERIKRNFYQTNAEGKLVNAGWPTYVEGELTEAEQARVAENHELFFSWESRKVRLLSEMSRWEADLISLVECDHYDDFFEPRMASIGFDGVFKKRPRPNSHDGCAIFWRRGVFTLLASQGMEFVDRVEPTSGKVYKDRCGLLALLQHCSGRRLIFISTHLARNPEDNTQTKQRAKQTAQLMKGLTDFANFHGACHEPAILAGDLNTTNIRQIADIARTVFDLCNQRAHPFVFSAHAPRSLPTSVTTSRRMCIDYLFIQSSLEVVDQDPMESLAEDSPIPNGDHPSDHLPIVFTLAFRLNTTQLSTVARSWVSVVLAGGGEEDEAAGDIQHLQPMRRPDLMRAFAFFDVAGDGNLCPVDLDTGLRDLGMFPKLGLLFSRLEALLERPFRPGGSSTIDFAEFAEAYLSAFLHVKSHFIESMRDAFAYFDSSGDGSLQFDELHQTFVDACPFEIDSETFAEIFEGIDADGDGEVTIDEFIEYLLEHQTMGGGRRQRSKSLVAPLKTKPQRLPQSLNISGRNLMPTLRPYLRRVRNSIA